MITEQFALGSMTVEVTWKDDSKKRTKSLPSNTCPPKQYGIIRNRKNSKR